MGGAPAPRTTPGPAAPTAARGANARSQPRTVEVGPAPRSGHLLPVPPRPMPGAPARHRQAGRQGREAVAEKTPVKRNCVRPVVRRHPYGEPDAGGPVPGWHWRPGINLEDSLLLTRAGGPDDTSGQASSRDFAQHDAHCRRLSVLASARCRSIHGSRIPGTPRLRTRRAQGSLAGHAAQAVGFTAHGCRRADV